MVSNTIFFSNYDINTIQSYKEENIHLHLLCFYHWNKEVINKKLRYSDKRLFLGGLFHFRVLSDAGGDKIGRNVKIIDNAGIVIFIVLARKTGREIHTKNLVTTGVLSTPVDPQVGSCCLDSGCDSQHLAAGKRRLEVNHQL